MLSGWTSNCGCELIDSETANILGYTGDENIPVERGVYKYILRPYDISGQNGNPRLYADQVFSGNILRDDNDFYQFTMSNNVVYTNFYPKQIKVKRCKQQTKPYGTYHYCKRKRKLSESVQVY